MGKNSGKRKRQKRRLFENKVGNDCDSNRDSNPFEFHRNKVKHEVIGRHLAKNEFGNRGLSRNRALIKRKDTLLVEYKQKHKTGKGLQDLRIKDNEKRIRNRFTEINKSIEFSKDNNLILTHKGKHLNDFIDDRIGSDDEDIDLFNRPEFVESTHFGGGSDGRPKSANEVLNDIMNEKREKQLENAANNELTEKLDIQWNSIKNILRHKGVKHEMSDNVNEDFDLIVKQLMFADKAIITKNLTTQTSDKTIEKESDSIKRSPDSLFKESLDKIENENDWTAVSKIIKDLIDNLLPKVTNDSLNILYEKYQTITELKSPLTLNNMAFLMIGSYIKQTKLIVKIILIQILSRLKFKTYQEIGQILIIIRFLFILSKGKYIPEIFNSIINVIRLAQHKESVVLTVGHKQNCCVKCILAINEDSLEKKVSVFNIKYIFDNKLNSYNESEENDLKSMLLLETLKITDEVYDSYSTLPSFNEIITPLKDVLKQLSDYSFASDIKDCLNKLLIKFNKELPKVLLHESRPKPFMLPMFEPKFDDSHSNTATEKKKLVKKYKRELKGAQRELRKDSSFMRSTWIHEIQQNDAQRKRKVKELFGDLANQMSLYKKKK
jgi:hypothetical protein